MSIDRFIRIVLLRLRSLVRWGDVERELDDEVRYHIERQVEENIRLGMAPSAARTAALRAFGGVEYQKEEIRDRRGTRWLEDLIGDVRFSLRSLKRTPAFTATVIITLALGIGANTAMFTVLHGALLRASPNRDAGRLLFLRQETTVPRPREIGFSVPEVNDYRSASTTIEEFAEYSSASTALPFTFRSGNELPIRPSVAIVSGNYFRVLGLDAELGRLIDPADGAPSAAPVAVFSHEFWTTHFGADPRIIGRVVSLNDLPVVIIGVARPAAPYPERTDVFANTASSAHHLSAMMTTSRTHRMSQVFARLAPGATLEQAQRELAGLAARAYRDHAEAYDSTARYELSVLRLRDAVNERAARTLWLLMGAALLVFIIACANVSNLTMIRSAARERELQVRLALGASKARLRRLLIAENLVVALTGGALAVAVAIGGTNLLVSFTAQFSTRAADVRVDGVVLAVCLGTSIVAALLLSFIPPLRDANPGSSLVSASRRATMTRERQRFQRGLVVAQVALCVVLLAGAALMARTLIGLTAIDTGVHADRVLAVDLPLPGDFVREVGRRAENLVRYERIRDRVAAVPGAAHVALTSGEPLHSSVSDIELPVEGHELPANQPAPRGAYKAVDPGYFDITGVPLLSGRRFLNTDRFGSARVAIVSKSLAEQLFGSGNPVGQRIGMGEGPFSRGPTNWVTVVGVVADTRDRGLDGAMTATVYRPFAQDLIITPSLVIRTGADPVAVEPDIVRAIRNVEPAQVIERVMTIDQIRDESIAPRRVTAVFIACFGALAFVIAMVGIGGLLAYSVSTRTSEFGIRMSLGADAGSVRAMVLREGGQLLIAGVVIGAAAATVATRLLRTLLFAVSPTDPATLAGVAVVLIAAGLVSCWLPAAKAARVSPATALRAE
jgi:putative ABC transport system permease protein